MKEQKKITDIEMLEALLDPRRKRIIELAKAKPLTVKQIASGLGEKPSRLYYHVKKLEENDLLILVETKQQGNLIEKYYQTNEEKLGEYKIDDNFLKEHSSSLLKGVKQVISPGLKLLEHAAKEGSHEKQIELTITYSNMSGEEWELSHKRMKSVISEEKLNKLKNIQQLKELVNDHDSRMSKEDLEKQSDYVHVVLSYRIKDAQDLNLIDDY
ncbi:winged helix-turn-helix domain-containing protein [Chengkuizengella sediminis]|uniref:winged helix-turn-helix domain-containing protein n=1 Tax=Chengkuizengella sediminis TaxID=1885917 RepID=UPI0013899C9C|nr:helix-turn-helix domain-containing protein [Chengkuizengella sediminis]NDI34422.1 helix-turn-helix transcriptional regulator [Chengkuizengella sediminis]